MHRSHVRINLHIRKNGLNHALHENLGHLQTTRPSYESFVIPVMIGVRCCHHTSNTIISFTHIKKGRGRAGGVEDESFLPIFLLNILSNKHKKALVLRTCKVQALRSCGRRATIYIYRGGKRCLKDTL